MALIFNDENFEEVVLKSDEPVLVDCWASWCRPCIMMGKIIDELAEKYKGAKIGKLNVDENKAITAEYPVSAIPTLMFFKDGKVVDKIVGVVNKEAISKKLDELKGQ